MEFLSLVIKQTYGASVQDRLAVKKSDLVWNICTNYYRFSRLMYIYHLIVPEVRNLTQGWGLGVTRAAFLSGRSGCVTNSVVSNSLWPHGLQPAMDRRQAPLSMEFSRDGTQVSCIAGRFFTIWTTRGSSRGGPICLPWVPRHCPHFVAHASFLYLQSQQPCISLCLSPSSCLYYF